MNLHEFQAKQLLREVGISVAQGELVDSPLAAVEAARQLGGNQWIVKAQVHAGERAAAGGIRRIDDLDQLLIFSQSLLGKRLITPQNAPEGQPVSQLLIEVPFVAVREYFMSVTTAPRNGKIVFFAAALGMTQGLELSNQQPENYHCVEIEPVAGLQEFQCRQLALKLGINKAIWLDFFKIVKSLYKLLIDRDLLLVELNSFAEDSDGKLVVLGAKICVDDNALPRQARLAELMDLSQDGFHPHHTRSQGLELICLEGDIGCVVNGTGLALATLDMLKLKGGSIGNIIDVGDGASAIDLAVAFEFLWDGGHCKAILVNIIGGIVQCDTVAAGVLDGLKQYKVNCPVIVRMEGTRADEAREQFIQYGRGVQVVEDFDIAVMMAISSVAE